MKRIGRSGGDWNLKDLREMRRNANALKKNNEACKGILIAPSKRPRFSRLLSSNDVRFSPKPLELNIRQSSLSTFLIVIIFRSVHGLNTNHF